MNMESNSTSDSFQPPNNADEGTGTSTRNQVESDSTHFPTLACTSKSGSTGQTRDVPNVSTSPPSADADMVDVGLICHPDDHAISDRLRENISACGYSVDMYADFLNPGDPKQYKVFPFVEHCRFVFFVATSSSIEDTSYLKHIRDAAQHTSIKQGVAHSFVTVLPKESLLLKLPNVLDLYEPLKENSIFIKSLKKTLGNPTMPNVGQRVQQHSLRQTSESDDGKSRIIISDSTIHNLIIADRSDINMNELSSYLGGDKPKISVKKAGTVSKPSVIPTNQSDTVGDEAAATQLKFPVSNEEASDINDMELEATNHSSLLNTTPGDSDGENGDEHPYPSPSISECIIDNQEVDQEKSGSVESTHPTQSDTMKNLHGDGNL